MLVNIRGLRILIICIIAFFLFAINIFQTRSENLKIETRFLYTDQALEIYADFNLAIKLLQRYSDYYRVFGILSSHPDIRVFYSNCYRTWTPPLRTGRFFTEVNTYEAVIGRLVADTDGYIYFLENYYRIIGRLGASGTRLLDNTIILNNTALFSETVSPYLAVDGDVLSAEIAQSFQHKPLFRGADQMRIDVDFLTPVVAIWGRMLAFLSSSLFAFFYFDQKKELLKAKYLIGKPILPQCLNLTTLFLLFLIPYSFSLMLVAILPSIQISLLHFSRDIVALLLISAGTFLLCGMRFAHNSENRILA